jgi:hypothetical protein
LFRALETEDDSSDDSDDEARTIALFDEYVTSYYVPYSLVIDLYLANRILRKEGGGLDPFVTRRYIAAGLPDLEDDEEDIEIDPE